MKSNKEIIECMFSDLESYKEYMEEWMEEHLERYPAKRISWSAWFEGAQGKVLDDADAGIEFNGWHHQDYKKEIEYLIGKEPVRMHKSTLGVKPSIILNNREYIYNFREERDADYRKGSSMVVQIIETVK